MLSHQLIEWNCVAKATISGMRGRGQKAIISWVASIHIGMRYTPENREIIAVLAKNTQIGRQLAIETDLPGKEKIRKQAKVLCKFQVTTWDSTFSRDVPLVSGTNNFTQVSWRIIMKQKKPKTTLAGKTSTIDGKNRVSKAAKIQ